MRNGSVLPLRKWKYIRCESLFIRGKCVSIRKGKNIHYTSFLCETAVFFFKEREMIRYKIFFVRGKCVFI